MNLKRANIKLKLPVESKQTINVDQLTFAEEIVQLE
jgi:hypothetical protein